jgi:hypothetical protein
MLARLKRASRRSIALIWAMAALFALAPGMSMALAHPVGAFSRSFMHVHAGDEPGHMHHGHYHHHHLGNDHHDGADHHHHDGTDNGFDQDNGNQRLHVHHDASCPSLVMPTVYGDALEHHPSDRIAILKVEPMQGAPPDRLFRPPIPV